MMNDANIISRQTKLFGYIGENAGVSRFSAVMNKMFKENSDDYMMIPMNIREDDLYFTLTNMKKSQVDGAVIATEYIDDILEILDESSTLVKRTKMCDIVFKEGEKLRGDIFSTRVLSEFLKERLALKVAIFGISSQARAFSLLACDFNISYFHNSLEELMEFTKEMELVDADLNRVTESMSIDLSAYDVFLDFSDFDSLSMIKKLPKSSLDMKNTKQFSALKSRAKELETDYISYDDMIEQLATQAYCSIRLLA